MKEQICCWECGKALVDLDKSNKDWRVFCTHECLQKYRLSIVAEVVTETL